MAGLTANRPTDQYGGVDSGVLPHRIPVPIADNVHIYQGGMVQLDANGRANPAAGTNTTNLIVGRAYEEYDNTVAGHSAGALTVEVEQGSFMFDINATHPPLQANVGAEVYASDDHTISINSGDGGPVGILLAIINVPEWGNQAVVQIIFGLV